MKYLKKTLIILSLFSISLTSCLSYSEPEFFDEKRDSPINYTELDLKYIPSKDSYSLSEEEKAIIKATAYSDGTKQIIYNELSQYLNVDIMDKFSDLTNYIPKDLLITFAAYKNTTFTVDSKTSYINDNITWYDEAEAAYISLFNEMPKSKLDFKFYYEGYTFTDYSPIVFNEDKDEALVAASYDMLPGGYTLLYYLKLMDGAWTINQAIITSYYW
ncbi:hypothetical protein [Spirochaeta cellobiosiphila]|uniref:hypothetical protein n=1 Tax=Spirochaeta cellobiosiphila TaxID=504483 RepID=UPI000404207F|nr:hypothetical protein [Spirochaeta cellobiosiphila]